MDQIYNIIAWQTLYTDSEDDFLVETSVNNNSFFQNSRHQMIMLYKMLKTVFIWSGNMKNLLK